MKKKPAAPRNAAEPRRPAETKLRKSKQGTATPPAAKAKTQRLVHELQLHQIELKRQNEKQECLAAVQDIPECKKFKEALKIDEVLFRELYDNMKSGSVIFTVINDGSKGSDYIVNHMNRSGLKMEGKAIEEVVGKKLIDLRPTIDSYGLIPVMKKVWETGKSAMFPTKIYIDEHYSNYYENYIFKLPSGEVVTLYNDVTESKRIEENLRESEERFRTVAFSSPDHILVQDRDLRYSLVVNPQPGLTEADYLGNTDRDILEKEEAENLIAIKRKVIETGKPFHLEASLLNLKGETEYFDGSYIPKFDSTGKPDGLIGYFRNITERKRAEEALKAERQRLHDVLETMPVMVCLLTPDYRVAFANRAFRDKFGESHGRHCYEYCFGKKEPCDFCETYSVLKTGKSHHWQVSTPDGASVIDAYDFPFADVDGSPMILEVDIDITERKRAEAELIEKEMLNFALFEYNPIQTVFVDLEGKVIKFNLAKKKSGDRLPNIGDTMYKDYAGKHKIDMYAELMKCIKSGEEKEFPEQKYGDRVLSTAISPFHKGAVIISEDITERKQAEKEIQSLSRFPSENPNPVLRIARDGTLLYTNQAGSSLLPEWHLQVGQAAPPMLREAVFQSMNNGITQVLDLEHRERVYSFFVAPVVDAGYANLYGRDITERKRQEEEIRKNNAELKTFVHMVSHDLKNPVVSIQGFCSLLMKNHIKDLNEKALFYIQRMQANAGLMTDLLEDLVELSQIGSIKDKKTKISVQEVIKSIWAEASTSLAAQNVEFVFPENLPQLCYSEKRLYQIFYNLLANALKFRDEERKTKVEIGHQEDKDHYIFFVRDNGIGIEQKYYNKIFESFSQLKDIKSEGTGMGLAIVKKIVEANQGKVWVESRKGAGSTFYFTIPKNVKS